jgi:hypothetical protein
MGLESMAVAAELRRLRKNWRNNGSSKNQVRVTVNLKKPSCGQGWTAGLGKNCSSHRKIHKLVPHITSTCTGCPAEVLTSHVCF